jgi:hypothetical protein
VRKGASKPDISNEETFKRTLLAAKSITYTKESATGVYVTRLLDRLGLTETIKAKLTLQRCGSMTTPAVAHGEAELAIGLISDINGDAGRGFSRPAPGEYPKLCRADCCTRRDRKTAGARYRPDQGLVGASRRGSVQIDGTRFAIAVRTAFLSDPRLRVAGVPRDNMAAIRMGIQIARIMTLGSPRGAPNI